MRVLTGLALVFWSIVTFGNGVFAESAPAFRDIAGVRTAGYQSGRETAFGPAKRSPSAAPGGATLFISVGGAVEIYRNDQLAGSLNGFSFSRGLATDRAGNLYVADSGAHQIDIYAKGYRGRPTVLSDPNESPDAVTVSADGTVAAADFSSASVAFYAKGAKMPTSVVSNPLFASAITYAAFDAHGNLYVIGYPGGISRVVGVIVGGIHGKTITNLSIDDGLFNAFGIQVTPNGLIAIGGSGNVLTCEPPTPGHPFLKIVATTPLNYIAVPVGFVLTPSSADLALVDDTGFRMTYADLLTYPHGDIVKSLGLGEATPFSASR